MKQFDSVFIIDDDPIYVGALKHLIRYASFCNNFKIFENGQKALDELSEIFRLKSEKPDVILLDINMPVMDGWQFLDELSTYEESKDLIIYIVSSSNDPEDLKLAEMHGKSGFYINKPLDVEKLRSILRHHLNKE